MNSHTKKCIISAVLFFLGALVLVNSFALTNPLKPYLGGFTVIPFLGVLVVSSLLFSGAIRLFLEGLADLSKYRKKTEGMVIKNPSTIRLWFMIQYRTFRVWLDRDDSR